MCFPGSRPHPTCWLNGNGPKEPESLFRRIVLHPSAPILIANPEQDGTRQAAGGDLNTEQGNAPDRGVSWGLMQFR